MNIRQLFKNPTAMLIAGLVIGILAVMIGLGMSLFVVIANAHP